MAKLHAVFACMGVGKSEDLIREYNSYKLNGIHVLAFKSKIDTRNGNVNCIIKSRNGSSIPAIWINEKENIFEKITQLLKANSIIKIQKNIPKALFFDEVNFLTKEQLEQISDIVDYYNIDCYCYSLLTNFMGYLFEGSKRLIELTDHDCIKFLTTRDSKGNIPNINAKIKDGKIIKEGKEIEVGDSQYKPLTRKNWKINVIE